MKLSLILLILFSVSCGSQSKNMTKKGSFHLSESGGIKGGLTFDRASWYTELNMLLDIHTLKVEPDSPVLQWFGKNTREEIRECNQFYVLMTYILDTVRTPANLVLNQIKEQGFRQVAVNQFAKNIQLHPDARAESLQLYKFYGFCSDLPSRKISINIPNYKILTIN